VNLTSANALIIKWSPNPVREKTYQYTVYYYKKFDSAHITKINTTTNRVSIEGLEALHTYIFYITSWNHNLSGDLVESAKSKRIRYQVPNLREELGEELDELQLELDED